MKCVIIHEKIFESVAKLTFANIHLLVIADIIQNTV